MPRYLLVGNPTAQSGKNAARIAEARRLLDEAGLAHDFLPTQPAGATVGEVSRALDAGGYQVAIYMGGDGTFAEVAKGILGARRGGEVALGMLPTGTANDQGRSFGLSAEEADLRKNVAVLAADRRAGLDAGRIRALDGDGALQREDWFFDSAGWGLSPRVLQVRNEDRKAIEKVPLLGALWRDQLVYAGALFRTFLASYVDDDKFEATLEHDGTLTLLPGLTDLVVKGTRVYGGAWVFDPTSRPDDGLFEVVPFCGKRDWVSKALVHLDESGAVAEALGTIGVSHSPIYRAARIVLTLHPHPGGLPLCAQIDGEEFPATQRVEIEVVSCALTLVVPEAYATA